jgi:hypothetical protein
MKKASGSGGGGGCLSTDAAVLGHSIRDTKYNRYYAAGAGLGARPFTKYNSGSLAAIPRRSLVTTVSCRWSVGVRPLWVQALAPRCSARPMQTWLVCSSGSKLVAEGFVMPRPCCRESWNVPVTAHEGCAPAPSGGGVERAVSPGPGALFSARALWRSWLARKPLALGHIGER